MAPDFERHRPQLTAHCYRLLGSVVDAEDAVQETLLRAWKAREQFDGRAQLSTWLHRIATNVCLDALRGRQARLRAMDLHPANRTTDDLPTRPRAHWLEPVPDLAVIPDTVDVHEQLVLRESIRLAFVAALQHLPPRQRAALLLMQVLNWSAAETADALGMTVPAVNSAVQRARATLAERRQDRHLDQLMALGARDPRAEQATLTPAQRALVDEFAQAFEAYDVPRLVQLLRDDATMCMPPYDFWLAGRADIADWLTGRGAGCGGSRLVPVHANGVPAFAQYRRGGAERWAIVVLEFDGDRIGHLNYFLDTETLFPRFGLPPQWPAPPEAPSEAPPAASVAASVAASMAADESRVLAPSNG